MAKPKPRGPVTYTSYWPDWRCAQAQARGLEGRPIERVWGGWNQGTYYGTMQPGDRVVLVGLWRGCVYVFGRIEVVEVLSSEAWLERTQDSPPDACAGTVIVAREGTALRFDRGLPGSTLEGWEFETIDADPRPFKGIEDGLVKRGNQLMATIRITPATAERLHEFIDHGDLHPSEDPSLARLERRLHRDPDGDSMRVYIDALLAAGDPRGEIAALERRIADPGAPNGVDKLALAKKLWRLGTKHMPTLCGRPGGFPFRTNWALHRVEPKASKLSPARA